MTDIVERLRKYRPTDECNACSIGVRHTICDEAADEIERLNIELSKYAYERDVARRERDEVLTEKQNDAYNRGQEAEYLSHVQRLRSEQGW